MSLELTHPHLVHPRTGEPLRALGIRPNGEPLWPIMGGDGSESDANDDTGGAGDDEGAEDTGRDDERDTGRQSTEDDEGDEDEDEDDPKAKRAARQAARYRTQLRETEQRLERTEATMAALRQALDPDAGEGDGEADPTELAGQVEQLTSDNATLRAELVVHELAGDNGANANALLDSRGFLRTLQGLDPEGDNYRDEVAQAIKDAASNNAALRAGQGSGRGGSELDTERRERQRQRPKSLGAAVGAAYGS